MNLLILDSGEPFMGEIYIKQPGEREARQLAKMLCDDDILRSDLGIPSNDRPTAESFLKKISDWCHSQRAITYAIMQGNIAVGTISLSHRSTDGQSAQIGYWVGSNYRRLGYCKAAFNAVLAQAKDEGITTVTATIASDNIASQRLWERNGAQKEAISEKKFLYKIEISKQ